MKKFILISFYFFALHSKGQNLLFEDSKGKSATVFPHKGTSVATDIGDKSLSFNTNYEGQNFYTNSNISAKSNNRTYIINVDDGLNPTFNYKFNLGYKNKTDTSNKYATIRFASIQYKLQYDEFKLYSPDSVFSNQISKNIFRGNSVGLLLGTILPSRVASNIYSIGLTYFQSNNIDNLSKVSINDEVKRDTTTGTIRTVNKSSNALMGDYKKYNEFDIHIDMVQILHFSENEQHRKKDDKNTYDFANYFYYRGEIIDKSITHNIGYGLLFIEDFEKTQTHEKRIGNKMKLVGGLIIEYKNVDNLFKKSDNLVITLKTGVTF